MLSSLGNRKLSFKGAIFDLDGTLIDSMGIWSNVGKEFLLSHGIAPPEDIEHILKPMSFYESAKYFMDTYKINRSPREIMDWVYDGAAEAYRSSVQLKAAVKDYLQLLNEKQVKMCVATASDRGLAEAALIRLEIWEYFEFIMTCDGVKAGKNEPKIYLEAAKRLKIGAEEICIFEDALYCIKTAKKAGFKVIGIHDSSANEELEEIKSLCDQFVFSFRELL